MISIIVPIYNAEKYLHACLDSLLCQTVQDLQIILVNDGSMDNSLDIAQAYANKDKRILVISQKNTGLSGARNFGLLHAKGEYVSFLDADDSIEPDWCERYLEAIDKVDYVQGGYRRTKQTKNGLWISHEYLPRNRYQFVSSCLRLYRRKAIANIHFQEGMLYEDVLFSIDLWLSEASYRMINYAGYLYTLNPNSITSHSHWNAQRKVLHELKARAKGATLKGKMIIWYTIIRLKCHYLLR